MPERRDELAEAPVPGLVVGPKQHLVGGVKSDQAAGRWVLIQHRCPSVIGKDTLDKVLSKPPVVQSALFLDRQ